MSKLYTYCTHDLVAEGSPVKTHLTNGDGSALCGFTNSKFGSTDVRIDQEWLRQPDPEGELCKKCKQIAGHAFCFAGIQTLPDKQEINQ